jgi:hypothetical protein
MDTNKKTIQINPELFKINGGNTTRKKTSSLKNPDKIKIKTQEKAKKMSTIKRNILKMIRNHQDERRKKKMDVNTEEDILLSPEINTIKKSSISQTFQNEFNESLEYLSNLSKDVDKKKEAYTIKRYPSIPVSSSHNLQEPTYGCLKNGKLPTYRTWLNQTRKHYPSVQNNIPQPQPQPQIILQQSQPPQIHQSQPQPQILIQNPKNNNEVKTELNEKKINNQIQQFSKIQQFERKNNPLEIKKWKYPKQKRIIRRTYYVGRSKVHPRISVLVSNKTIRARTTLKQQELKQVPISEVKKYLLKNGFIKVGTSSPNDVLREMYESAQLICGEIKNHNSENLLYNYFNAPSSEL